MWAQKVCGNKERFHWKDDSLLKFKSQVVGQFGDQDSMQFRCHGPGSIPGWGTEITQATWHVQKSQVGIFQADRSKEVSEPWEGHCKRREHVGKKGHMAMAVLFTQLRKVEPSCTSESKWHLYLRIYVGQRDHELW